MSQLPPDLMKKFLSSKHAARHQRGWWNDIWQNMMIETSVMRFGHGPHGMIGITLNKKTLEFLALSLHATTQLEQELECLDDIVKSLVIKSMLTCVSV